MVVISRVTALASRISLVCGADQHVGLKSLCFTSLLLHNFAQKQSTRLQTPEFARSIEEHINRGLLEIWPVFAFCEVDHAVE